MWKLLDSLGRPPLPAHLQLCALELNQQGLRMLERCSDDERAGSRALFATLTAGAACWPLLRPLLRRGTWKRVRDNLRQQDRLLRPLRAVPAGVIVRPAEGLERLRAQAAGTKEVRCLARLRAGIVRQGVAGLAHRQRRALRTGMHQQARWLGELTETATRDEAPLRAAMVTGYRNARRAFRDRPGSGRSRRRLARLAWWEELMRAPPGPMHQIRLPRSAAGRLWMDLEEDRWLRRLVVTVPARSLGSTDAARLQRLVERRRLALADAVQAGAARVFAATPHQFAERLPWRIFEGLAESPGALAAGWNT